MHHVSVSPEFLLPSCVLDEKATISQVSKLVINSALRQNIFTSKWKHGKFGERILLQGFRKAESLMKEMRRGSRRMENRLQILGRRPKAYRIGRFRWARVETALAAKLSAEGHCGEVLAPENPKAANSGEERRVSLSSTLPAPQTNETAKNLPL